jgi:hypothetical protein
VLHLQTVLEKQKLEYAIIPLYPPSPESPHLLWWGPPLAWPTIPKKPKGPQKVRGTLRQSFRQLMGRRQVVSRLV